MEQTAFSTCEILKPYLCFVRVERIALHSSDHLMSGENLYLSSRGDDSGIRARMVLSSPSLHFVPV